MAVNDLDPAVLGRGHLGDQVGVEVATSIEVEWRFEHCAADFYINNSIAPGTPPLERVGELVVGDRHGAGVVGSDALGVYATGPVQPRGTAEQHQRGGGVGQFLA